MELIILNVFIISLINIYVWVPEKTGRVSLNLKIELVVIMNCSYHNLCYTF